MKVYDLFEYNVNSDPNDTQNGFYNPMDDELNKRSYDDTQKKKLTLKKVNKLKKIRAIKKLEAIKRQKVYSIIYGGGGKEDDGGGSPF